MIETLSYTHYSLALLIIIIAYTFRGVTGFGSGLISIPLLALFLPLTFVVPFISIMDISASIIHVIHTRKHVAWKVIFRAIPFAVFGVIFGLFIIKSLNTLILVKALGVFIILFAIYSLISPTLKKNNSPVWPVFAGFFGSLIGTLFGTGGPFYVFYFQLQQLDKTIFRATCAAVFLIDGLIRATGFTISGFYTSTVLLNIAFALPIMFLAMYMGEHLHTNISQRTFQKAIGIFLIFSGIALLLKN
ncbi:MAG: sulfite exporter TauE/SafE family protein [Gammaproteobacteria bacterium]|nr:sulfite exporter TauE/SafE family protein [Gammaproteobacteria bacterium]MDH5661346.1 sulfite exporter TauE/SafE family protein [Gammaproteobacteria bacterium]